MNADISCLRDPNGQGPLALQDDGYLVGTDGHRYPVVDGIPRFVSSENYAQAFGVQWKRFPETQLDSRTGIPISEERLEHCFQGQIGDIKGKRVLEAGSGAGRFTEILLRRGAIIHSFDYSSAVEANAHNNGGSDSLTLVQADIRQIPFEKASYDYVVCIGVLQHTPNPEESIEHLYAMLKPGGMLVIDHYRRKKRDLLPIPRKLYRQIILRIPEERQFTVVKAIVDFWFPIHWRFRDQVWIQRILNRLTPLHFYYPHVPLRDRQMYYEWALLDTNDSTTDYFRHTRTVSAIERCLLNLGASEVRAGLGGNGIEATCKKP